MCMDDVGCISNECLNVVANSEMATRNFNLLSNDDETMYRIVYIILICGHSVKDHSMIKSDTLAIFLFAYLFSFFSVFVRSCIWINDHNNKSNNKQNKKYIQELKGKKNFRFTHLVIRNSMIISMGFFLTQIIMLSSYTCIHSRSLKNYNWNDWIVIL